MRQVSIPGISSSLVLLVGASCLLLGPGVRPVEASGFEPTLTASVPLNGAGAASDIQEAANFGFAPTEGQRSLPASAVYFTPADWGIPDCSPSAVCPFALNEKTGELVGTLSLGILNSQCAVGLPVAFPAGMLNASTDPADSIPAGVDFANLMADTAPADGIADGVEHWNDLLDNLIAAGSLPSAPPRERQILSTIVAGLPVWIDVLTYDPGLFGGAATAPLGYATVFVFQNFNPTKSASPGLITDVCGLFNAFTQAGVSSGGTTHRSNPGIPGTRLFLLQATSDRDADQGPSAAVEPTLFALPGGLSGAGLVNGIDTCPFQPDLGSVLAPVGAPFDGDGGEAPGDGIDAVCDADPAAFDGTDSDTDGYLNRADNCPQLANGAADDNQADLSELSGLPAANEVGPQPADGGPPADRIGDACDLNPAVPDGHFHTALRSAPVCVTGPSFADGDGDGWCDADETDLGGDTAGTPEALAVPGACSDGTDNDEDGGVDLADTGCQLAAHDVSIAKFKGTTVTCNSSNTRGTYTVILDNSRAVAENAEISIYLDSQPAYVPPPGPTPAPGKSAGSVAGVSGASVTQSGPINIDGDADVEWLTKATVAVKAGPAATPVRFNVTYPGCGAGPNATAVDYTVALDLCHADDVAPLGVNPLFGACAGGAADGGQDTNNAVITRSVDDLSR